MKHLITLLGIVLFSFSYGQVYQVETLNDPENPEEITLKRVNPEEIKPPLGEYISSNLLFKVIMRQIAWKGKVNALKETGLDKEVIYNANPNEIPQIRFLVISNKINKKNGLILSTSIKNLVTGDVYTFNADGNNENTSTGKKLSIETKQKTTGVMLFNHYKNLKVGNIYRMKSTWLGDDLGFMPFTESLINQMKKNGSLK